jgi:hypothetical protein
VFGALLSYFIILHTQLADNTPYILCQHHLLGTIDLKKNYDTTQEQSDRVLRQRDELRISLVGGLAESIK